MSPSHARRLARLASTSLAALLVLAACAPAGSRPSSAVAPAGSAEHRLEIPRRNQRVEARNGVVAAAHPAAAEAGLEMLRRGGNAVDAAVATSFALAVVEQQMAGLGGGGAMTIWLDGPKRAEYLDFYATAGADPTWAAPRQRGQPVPPELMVAVPGAVDGLLVALERHGTLPRDVVLAPAIRLARDGFPVHALLAGAIANNRDKLTRTPEVARIFYPGGRALQAGDLLVQRELAATLERIARHGRDGFHAGPVAEEIVRVLRAGGNPITMADLRGYRTTERRPLCTDFRGYTFLSAPPPLVGLEVFATLELLERHDLARLGLPAESPEALALVTDAVRLARADRLAWLGFPDDAAVPAVGISSEAYARERAALLGAPVPDSTPAGDPWDEERAGAPASCAPFEPYAATTLPVPAPEEDAGEADGADAEAQTTHLSVVDRDGNAVSLTYTFGVAFGSGNWAAGTFLNSANNNFGGPVANRRAPNRTPRTTTAPTIVLDGDRVRLVVGSPGSGYIPPAIVHTVLYTLVYGMDPWSAVAMPRVYPDVSSRAVEVEMGFTPEALAGLRRRGYDVQVRGTTEQGFGGVHVVLVRKDGSLVGAADPRRDGAAVGF
ncbi:MAG TPA: gamma-glutamyltransferase family protein [Gemmatimonadaceae bacterium]|nr:gamma-glutamyltransferase family protein [Gemmatimonadaceae bacterium]